MSEVSPDRADLLTRKPKGRCQNFKSIFWLTVPLLLLISSEQEIIKPSSVMYMQGPG